MSDPAISAAQRAWGDSSTFAPLLDADQDNMVSAAREMAKSVQEQLAVIRERYELVRTWMCVAVTSAEQSRHASELAGLRYAYNLIAPTVYPSEELNK